MLVEKAFIQHREFNIVARNLHLFCADFEASKILHGVDDLLSEFTASFFFADYRTCRCCSGT